MGMFEFSLSRAIIKSKYTIILTIGAIVGVTCLIVITSLFNNYYLTSERIFMGIHPHICLQKEGMTEQEAQAAARRVKEKFPAVAAAEPALYRQVPAVISKVNKKKFFCVRQNGGFVCYDEQKHPPDADLVPRFGFTIVEKRKTGILIKGISVENNETVSGIKKIINGSTQLDDLELNADENNNPLPWSLYMQQDLFPGALGLRDFLIQFPGGGDKPIHFMQRGTLGMGTQKGKYPLLVMSLKNAQECLKSANTANTIEIRLRDPYAAETTARDIARWIGTGYTIETWIQYSRASFAFLGIIKIMILAILFSISIVAAIGMVSTLTLIVMQNRGKIAILKSMGIKNSSIYKVFILNTSLTGFIGTTVGTALGYLGSHLAIRYFGENLRKLGITDPRILLEPREVLIIGALVMALFVLTAIIPSRRAIAADIVEGLQEQ